MPVDQHEQKQPRRGSWSSVLLQFMVPLLITVAVPVFRPIVVPFGEHSLVIQCGRMSHTELVSGFFRPGLHGRGPGSAVVERNVYIAEGNACYLRVGDWTYEVSWL